MSEPAKRVEIALESSADRSLIPPGTCDRYLVWRMRVGKDAEAALRTPLCLALVIDRSGSMSGEPLVNALRAAEMVISQLDGRDQFAVVIFDSEIEVLQPATAARDGVKQEIIAALRGIQARASTALHEGWLRGCQALAPVVDAHPDLLGRCFLLTDGQANVGIVDPEQIAGQAAEIRRDARIGTSTFGFGPGYNEHLLGPMAVAGGGQFHHLPSAEQIVTTFSQELADLFAVAARRVRLEFTLPDGVGVAPVSPYVVHQDGAGRTIEVGDLLPEDMREIVVKLSFDPAQRPFRPEVRARLLWQTDAGEVVGPWQTIAFTVATDAEADADAIDPAIAAVIGRELAEQTKRDALKLARSGDVVGGIAHVRALISGSPVALTQQLFDELHIEAEKMGEYSQDAAQAKEAYFQSQNKSRQQRDKRQK